MLRSLVADQLTPREIVELLGMLGDGRVLRKVQAILDASTNLEASSPSAAGARLKQLEPLEQRLPNLS